MGEEWSTREEAVEVWNTWRGRFVDVSPASHRSANPANDCSEFLQDGHYKQPRTEEMSGPIQMLLDGAFRVPWPRLCGFQAVELSHPTEPHRFSVQEVFGFRVRWCALFPSALEYRDTVTELLRHNDRENIKLNEQLQKWNEYWDIDPHKDFEVFLREVEEDPTGIFWG